MKKMITFALCMLLLLCSASAAVSVRMEDTAALLHADGREIVSAGIYEDIVPLGKDLFAAGNFGMYALMDEAGALLTDVAYSQIRVEDGMIIAEREGKWGLLHADGSLRSAFDYTLIVPGASGNCWALLGDPNDMESDKLYRIDPDGRQHATRVYVRAIDRQASEGMISVLIPGSGKYGYCDALGRMAIPARYEYAGKFTNGLAAVVQGGKYGAINRDGEIVIPPEYDFLEISEAGFVIAAKNREAAHVFDMLGEQIARYSGEDVYIALVGAGYAVVDSSFLYVYDAKGDMLLEAPADSVVMEGVDGQLIISEGMWGEECVYLNGSERKWQNLYPLGTIEDEPVYAAMRANVGRYMNDKLGEIQLSTDMDSARYGVTDGRGDLLLECEYISIENIGEDRLLGRTEDGWQMMDIAGNILWSHAAPMQTEAPSF